MRFVLLLVVHISVSLSLPSTSHSCRSSKLAMFFLSIYPFPSIDHWFLRCHSLFGSSSLQIPGRISLLAAITSFDIF
ncbi:hypothetical protein BDA96_01G058500 [Sorghum bicolor]|uniref:Secreted protein n=1 Tax=Sorghum bicolor TaxID=4558 RepID=A0A921RVH7_SORBI|nr:hypothetical protein BDA96_01G058500 [Sorghum bicolor]